MVGWVFAEEDVRKWRTARRLLLKYEHVPETLAWIGKKYTRIGV
jgi:hypothetical protein